MLEFSNSPFHIGLVSENTCGESHDRFIVDWGQFDPWPLNLYSPGKKTGYQGGEVSKFGANCF